MTKRDPFINVVKALSMLLVVIGHTRWAYGCHAGNPLIDNFIVGMRDVSVNKKLGLVAVVTFIAGLCFWNTAYSPWNMGALAWRENPNAFLICGYRFILGIAGVCAMGMVFAAIHKLCVENSFFVRTVVSWGNETLALYILQTLCIEIGLRLLLEHFMRLSAVCASDSIVRLIGYLIAPIMLF